MNTILRALVATAAAMLLAAGCATEGYEEPTLAEKLAQRGYAVGQPVEQLKDYLINGWNSVDRNNVIITVGASRNYLVSVRNPCEGLRSAERLAFTTTVGNLTDFDKLMVRGGGGLLEQCFIESIHELEKIDRAD